MAKFGSDFEIKWGLATDLELGKKVKVTILATGFGIEDVDGMGSHLRKQSQEDLNRIAAEQEKAAQKQDRRNRYYRGENSTKRYKRRPNIYLFRPEDLDNDDVISAVEQTPTYKRTFSIASIAKLVVMIILMKNPQRVLNLFREQLSLLELN